MKGLSGMVIWYTFLAIVIFLLLDRYKASNKLLKSGFGGYIGSVRALQGRDPSAITPQGRRF